jgi:hypothetical protein
MGLTEREAAARALQDADYAREVLNGDEHPRVREAILADWKERDEVTGYFNPQPDPPGDKVVLQGIDFNVFSMSCGELPHSSLKSLAKG